MRKVLSISLITFLLANGAGFYVYLFFRLNEIKREMRAEMIRTSPGRFQKIILTLREYEQAKEGDDEIEWNKSMYDIASIKFQGDQVKIFALRDDMETELLSFASRIIQFSSHDSKTPPLALMQYLSLTFMLPSAQINMGNRIAIAIIHNTSYQTIKLNPSLKIILHPPRG